MQDDIYIRYYPNGEAGQKFLELARLCDIKFTYTCKLVHENQHWDLVNIDGYNFNLLCLVKGNNFYLGKCCGYSQFDIIKDINSDYRYVI